MPVATNHVLRVDVAGDFNASDDLVNVYQYKVLSVTDASDAAVGDDFATYIRAQYALMDALWTSVVVWRRVRIQNLTTGLLIGEFDFSSPLPGSCAGDQGGIQVAALISLKTNVPRVVMRKYIPICEAGQTNTSLVSGGATTLLEAWRDELLAPQVMFSLNEYQFGYNSPKTGTFLFPLSGAVSPVLATQRRRRPGVGS